jgi:hypothetical protein
MGQSTCGLERIRRWWQTQISCGNDNEKGEGLYSNRYFVPGFVFALGGFVAFEHEADFGK